MPKKEKKQKGYLSDDAIDILAGAFSGMVAAGATYPMDTLSVRAQAANRNKNLKHHSPKAAKKTKGLYRGLGWKLTKTIPAGAVGYWGYGAAKRHLEENTKQIDKVLKKEARLRGATPSMEKDAFFGAMARFVPKAARGFGNFAKGFGGLGNASNLKNPFFLSGTGASIGMPRKFAKPKALANYTKATKTNKSFNITGKTKSNNFK